MLCRVCRALRALHQISPIDDVVYPARECGQDDDWTQWSEGQRAQPLPGPSYANFDKRMGVFSRPEDPALAEAAPNPAFESARRSARETGERAKVLQLDAEGRRLAAEGSPAFVLSTERTEEGMSRSMLT